MIPEAAAGTVLAGRYRIEREIERGGFATVYLATDLRLHGRRVAVKVLSPAMGVDAAFRERFVRESAMAVELDDHPGIVPVYDAGEDDGSLFIVMRYIEGTDLNRAIARYGPVPPATLVPILSQVAGALDVAHAAGLVHRDVKPGNILLTTDLRRAFLADFGLTKRVHTDQAITQAQQYLGTTYYSAPEQFEGAAVGPAADVYALGAVVYHALTGSPPYQGTPESVIAAHLTRPVPAVTAVRPDLGGPIDWVVAKAMAKAPEHRYQRAGDLAADAAHALGGADTSTFGPAPGHAPPYRAPSVAPPGPAVTTGPPPFGTGTGTGAGPARTRRRPLLVVAGVAAVVLLVVAVLALGGGGGGGGAGTFPNEDEAAILRTLPASFEDSCRRDGDGPAGAVAALSCAMTDEGGASTATFALFGSPSALDEAFGRLLDEADFEASPADDCSTAAYAAHAYQGSEASGQVFCARDIQRYTIVWTDTTSGVLGMGERADNDDVALYGWWSGLVGRTDGGG